MLSSSEISSLLSKFPRFDDTHIGLSYAPRMPAHMGGEIREVVAIARRFNDEVARPRALELDRKTHEDPGYMPWELVETANRWGFYSMWIPKIFGGRGWCIRSMSYFAEEVGSVCLGILNVIGVHYLGVTGIIASANTRLAKRVLNEGVEGEKSGKPCLVALAVTEPGAGTDVEEVELVARGKVACHAKKVPGGYVVNGTKVFISMGHVSTWTVLIAYEDLRRPAETSITLMVKTGARGFSFGTHENKMGQRVCPASELVFEDCFIPDDQVLFSAELAGKFTSKPYRDVSQRYIDYVVSATRPGVCAFGISAARGAFEAALAYASGTRVNGRPLVDSSWVQSLLAEMYKNVALGRLAYVEANHSNGLRGLNRVIQAKPVYYYTRYMPRAYFDRVVSPFLDKPVSSRIMGKLLYDMPKDEDQKCCSGWASLAKFAGTDLGVRNCQMAIELMGRAGLRQDSGAEKLLRDIKLLQIYEGTNQLNRLNLFKCLIAPQAPGTRVFDE
jgi:alkylation response protein AidB-like acyl-CoA dehydrogenase